MSKRIPLWATLVPLVVGLLGYFYWWSGQRDAFAAQLHRVLGPAHVEIRGFPYRMEATLGAGTLSRITPLIALSVRADRMAINRAPIGRPLTAIRALKPVVSIRFTALPLSRLDVAAASAIGSLRFGAGGIVARSSTAFSGATIRLAALASPAIAASFEVHVRETPQALDPKSRSPAFPEQAQFVLEGQGVRYAGGDALTLTAQFGIDARAPLSGGPAVLDGATLELKTLTLADAHGVIATLAATASPGKGGAALVSGTVDTVCPANVAALLAGRPGVREFRARRPVRLAFSGPVGTVAPANAATGGPVRSREPPCPVLRR